MSSRRASVSSVPGRPQTDLSGNVVPPVKKFMNGWTPELERLMAQWADIAGCYRWLHDRAEKGFSTGNAWITIPVIILSTLTGTANFALSSFIPPDNLQIKNYAQAGIGAVSIFAGILTTVGNFLRFAQGSEAHRVAGIAWGKLQRQIAVEVGISPHDREEGISFLQNCRQDLDRPVEQSPPIPDKVIAAFEKEFKDNPTLKRPDICHGLEHTTIFNSTKPRMMKMAAEATLYLRQRKKLLHDDLFPTITEKIAKSVKSEIDTKLQERWAAFEARAEARAVKKEVKKPVVAEPPNPTFLANWRRFIRHPEEPREVNERIYREDSDADTDSDSATDADAGNDDDVVVSIKSESTQSRVHSLTANEIIENISSGSSSSGMVISMTVNPNPTPITVHANPIAPPPHIVIPAATPAADLSGNLTAIELPGTTNEGAPGAPTDLSGSRVIE